MCFRVSEELHLLRLESIERVFRIFFPFKLENLDLNIFGPRKEKLADWQSKEDEENPRIQGERPQGQEVILCPPRLLLFPSLQQLLCSRRAGIRPDSFTAAPAPSFRLAHSSCLINDLSNLVTH